MRTSLTGHFETFSFLQAGRRTRLVFWRGGAFALPFRRLDNGQASLGMDEIDLVNWVNWVKTVIRSVRMGLMNRMYTPNLMAMMDLMRLMGMLIVV